MIENLYTALQNEFRTLGNNSKGYDFSKVKKDHYKELTEEDKKLFKTDKIKDLLVNIVVAGFRICPEITDTDEEAIQKIKEIDISLECVGILQEIFKEP